MLFSRSYKTTCALLCLIVAASSVSAQQNFLPGYLVTPDGDSLKGYLSRSQSRSHVPSVQFRDFSQKTSTYTPEDLQAFAAGDAVYISAEVEVDKSARAGDELDFSPALNLVKRKVFLARLASGKKELYHYWDENGQDNFYIHSGKNYELLKLKIYRKKEDDGSMAIRRELQYLEQLSLYLKDCTSIKYRLLNVGYDAVSLQKLFNYYSRCTAEKIEFKKTNKAEQKSYSPYGVVIGGAETKLHFSGHEDIATKAEFSSRSTFSIGMYANASLAGKREKWSLYNEVLFTRFAGMGEHSYQKNEEVRYTYYHEIVAIQLNLASMLRYRKQMGVVGIFANLGAGVAYTMSDKSQSFYIIQFPVSRKHYEDTPLPLKDVQFKGLAGTGFSIGPVSFEARYELGSNMSAHSVTGMTTSGWRVLAGFRF